MPTAAKPRRRPHRSELAASPGDRARIRRLVAADIARLQPGAERGWWLREALEADTGAACPPLAGEATADVVIVGGGFTGLWTAWWLLEHEAATRVTILESDIVGGGASGRNGGFLTGWWDYLPALVGSFGPEAGLAAAMALDGAPGWIGDWAARHDIDPWFRPGGTLVVSTSPAQDGAWDGIVELAGELGVSDRFLPLTASQVRARCASPLLRGGLLIPGDASVQPARLARGLRRVLLDRGVVIHEGTRVTDLREEGDGVRVTTDRDGALTAGRAVLAVNAWAAGWPGAGFGARMITWSSYMVLTEPIAEAVARARLDGWRGADRLPVHQPLLPDDRRWADRVRWRGRSCGVWRAAGIVGDRRSRVGRTRRTRVPATVSHARRHRIGRRLGRSDRHRAQSPAVIRDARRPRRADPLGPRV